MLARMREDEESTRGHTEKMSSQMGKGSRRLTKSSAEASRNRADSKVMRTGQLKLDGNLGSHDPDEGARTSSRRILQKAAVLILRPTPCEDTRHFASGEPSVT